MKMSIQTLIKNTRGFERMQLHALTGYTGINVARSNQPVIKNKKKTMFVCLEMSQKQIIERIASMLSREGVRV